MKVHWTNTALDQLQLIHDYIACNSPYYAKRMAILYGSYANGQVREESDIDVALISQAFTGDRFEDRRRIVPLRRKIDSRIEPMPFTPAGFSKGGNLIDAIKKNGIRIDVQ